ncbi:MAG TPA: AI-2E family transporter [Acidimicrobiales bacterium]
MAEPDAPVVPRWLASSAAVSWRGLVLVAALVVAGMAFQRLHLVIIPVVSAVFLSTILVPPARFLRRHGWPPLAATWAVFLAGFVLIAAVVVALVPVISSEASTLTRDLNSALTRTENWLTGSPLRLSRAQVGSAVKSIKSAFHTDQSRLVQGAVSGATVAAQVLGTVLLTLVLTFFFVKDGHDIADWALGLVDEDHAQDMREIGARSWAIVCGYVRGTAVNGLINAVVLSIGLLILGVPLVIPVGLLTFAGGFLPLVGGIVSGAVAVLVALATKGPVAALVMVGLTVLIHNLEGYLVGPLVLGRAVRLHPVAILVALTVGTILGGIVGAFLAVPLTAVALAINEYYRGRRRARPKPVVVAAVEGNGGERAAPGRRVRR